MYVCAFTHIYARTHTRFFFSFRLPGDYDPSPKYIVTVKVAFTNGTNMTVRIIAKSTID